MPQSEPLYPYMVIALSSGTTVTMDPDGAIYYTRPDGTRELLADSDSLCGIGLLNSGPNDRLRDACSWHDKGYLHRAFFEERGWNREDIDNYFLELMLYIVSKEENFLVRAHLKIRAR